MNITLEELDLSKRNPRGRPKAKGSIEYRLACIRSCMIGRCENPGNLSYKHYGARGVRICDEWRRSVDAFVNWGIASGFRVGLTIDRINNDGNYEPSNCRWATPKEQQNNRSNNNRVTYKGESHTVAQWDQMVTVNRYVIGDLVYCPSVTLASTLFRTGNPTPRQQYVYVGKL